MLYKNLIDNVFPEKQTLSLWLSNDPPDIAG